MDAVKYFEEKERMCKTLKDCKKCPLQHIDLYQHCAVISQQNPKEAVEIVEKWSEEHPQKTILKDFLEKYPNADMGAIIDNLFCPKFFGYKIFCTEDCDKSEDCWNRPLEG